MLSPQNNYFTTVKALILRKYERFRKLRIRDVYPGSRIRIFPHPGSRIWIRNTGFRAYLDPNLVWSRSALKADPNEREI